MGHILHTLHLASWATATNKTDFHIFLTSWNSKKISFSNHFRRKRRGTAWKSTPGSAVPVEATPERFLPLPPGGWTRCGSSFRRQRPPWGGRTTASPTGILGSAPDSWAAPRVSSWICSYCGRQTAWRDLGEEGSKRSIRFSLKERVHLDDGKSSHLYFSCSLAEENRVNATLQCETFKSPLRDLKCKKKSQISLSVVRPSSGVSAV